MVSLRLKYWSLFLVLRYEYLDPGMVSRRLDSLFFILIPHNDTSKQASKDNQGYNSTAPPQVNNLQNSIKDLSPSISVAIF